MKECYST